MKWALAAVAACFISAADMPVAAETSFQGKSINFVISTGPGGGIDTYARTFIQHFGSHVPGNPTIVAQNMPGAGGVRAARYIYNNGARDGTTIGLVHSSLINAPLLYLKDPGFDMTKVTWIGNIGNSPVTCAVWHTSTARNVVDLKSETLIVGVAGTFSGSEIYPRMMNELLGTRIKMVSGYESGEDIDLAMERGELQGRCAMPLSTLKAAHPDWLPSGKLRLLVQMRMERDPLLPEVPAIAELVSDARARSAIETIISPEIMLRSVMAPPNLPPDIVRTLRNAFEATVADPKFLADAAQRGVDVRPLTGERCEELVKHIYALPPEAIAEARKIYASAEH